MDIIEPVHITTPWISLIVKVPKPNQSSKIRICTDDREANKAIQRITPTLDDIIVDLNVAKYMSKTDLRAGYHQIKLASEWRYKTVFTTHMGLFQFKRLNFGINSSAEIFQNIIIELISDIPRSINISEDILLHGSNKEEHDVRLIQVLEGLNSKNTTVNKRNVFFAKQGLVSL